MARLILLVLVSFALDVLGQGKPTDYAPEVNVPCPSAPLLREFTPQTQSLHPGETEYISSRESSVLPSAWRDWLGDGSGIGYDLRTFEGKFPKVGIAISGGGYRAALYGAGVISALDARNSSAKSAGTGGMFQVVSYVSALSGGGWLSGSLILNDWPTVKDMIFGNGNTLAGWLLDLNLAIPDGVNLFNDRNQYYFGSILWSVMAKAAQGIDTSIVDPYARAISYHFLNQTNRANFFSNDTAHGAGQLWSHIPQSSSYQSRQAPFPLLVANSRPVGSNMTTSLPPEPVVYEITPLEFGSFDPNLSAMVNISYVGTHLANGQPPNSTGCVTGFDEAGFVMGTSASLFNTLLDSTRTKLAGFQDRDSSGLLYLLNRLLAAFRTRADDVANWPSPFNGLKPGVFLDSNATWLELIDGGSNLETIPFGPLFVRTRALDVILAVDASADVTKNWPNGTSLIFTAARNKNLLVASHQAFPPIPLSSDDFIKTGTSARPTFFGCEPKQNSPEYPLVIYLPNAPPANGNDPVTNPSTFKLDYSLHHTQLFLDQAHNNTLSGFVPNALGSDPNWGKCLQCATIDRSRFKLSPVPPRSAICSKCFSQYCFDLQHPPSKDQLPGRKFDFKDPDPQSGLDKAKSFVGKFKAPLIGVAIGVLVVLALIVFCVIRRRNRTKTAAYKRVMPDEYSAYELSEHGHLRR